MSTRYKWFSQFLQVLILLLNLKIMRKTKSVIKECKIHGLTEYAVISSTNKTYCRKCKAEQVNKRRNILLKKCYKYLGNKCSKCNKQYDIYDFHHINEKEKLFEINKGISRNLSFEKLKSELDKCILVCGNCHTEIHYDEDLKNDVKLITAYKKQQKRHKTKLQAIEYLGGKCSKCGYNKCKDALVFHHNNSNEKEFTIGDFLQNGFEFIKNELDKCSLLCRNCHLKEHKIHA